MDYVVVGRIITTHGLKGEMKIRSNFKYKDQVFSVGFSLYIGASKEYHKVLTYRIHKDYDMVIVSDIDDIDKAISYKQELVYVKKSDIKLGVNEYLDEDLIGLCAYYNNVKIGTILSITDEGNNNLVMRLDNGVIIPKNSNFIIDVDLDKKIINLKNVEGLL